MADGVLSGGWHRWLRRRVLAPWGAGLIASYLLLCSVCSAQEGDASADAAIEVREVETATPAASKPGGPVDPMVWAEQQQPKYEHHPPEPTPPDDPALVGLDPDEAALRAWSFQRLGVVAPEIRLRRVVLDFDVEDEVLVEIPFNLSDRTVQWLLLLDKRGDRYVVARQWTVEGRDARATVVAHGHGQRACLVVESQDGGWHEVELLQLQGRLVTLGAFGAGQGATLGVERAGAERTLTLGLPDGRRRRWRLRSLERGFEVEHLGETR